MTYPYGVQIGVVRVDAETGQATVERFLLAYDIGRSINPMLVEGQLVGGFVQGLGGALYEEFRYDERGQPLSVTLADYLLPTVRETPAVEVLVTEDAPSPLNPLGIKSVGEGGINGVGAVIAAAIDEAIGMPGGVTRLPATPQRIKAILREAAQRGRLAAVRGIEGANTMSNFEALIQDLVIANRILAREEVVDAYGHVSVRHPDNPNRFLIARSLAPELVGPEDIVELDLDGQPVRDEGRSLYLERFIHAAIFAARPDVMAVVHAHAEDTLPFGIAQGTKLRPVIHSGSFIGTEVPVWDIADNFGDTNLLVTNMAQASDLANMPRREQRGADARPRLRRRRALADRGRAAIGLPAAQRAGADAREAAGRRDQIPVARRDRGPQPGLQPLFGRDLAHLGILGEQGRLRPLADPARRRARASAPAKRLIRKWAVPGRRHC